MAPDINILLVCSFFFFFVSLLMIVIDFLIGKKLAPSSDSKTTSSGKKKSVRKAVNLSGSSRVCLLSFLFCLFSPDLLHFSHWLLSLELQRYFHAAEEAAREIMLEDAIKANYSNQNNQNGNDRDGVFQLTTLSSLPLKSPKRLIALQLANNNPSFRDRFRNKLEQTGGPLAMGGNNNNNKSGNNHNYLSSAQAGGGGGYNNYQGDHNQNNMNNQHDSAYSFDGELEKLINTPDWMRNGGAADSNTLFNTAMNGRSFLNQSDYSQQQQQNNYNNNNNRFASKEGRGGGGGGGTRGRSRSRENEIEANSGYDHPKLRQKRRKELDTDDINDQLYDGSNGGTGGSSLTSRIPDYSNLASSNTHYNLRGHNPHNMNMNDNSNDSSIIKRRRKGELQIMVDGSLGNNAVNPLPSAGPLTNAIRANNLHSLMGGGLLTNDHNNLNSLMGPPGETPTRRSARLKSGSLSTMSNLGK
jgi:hypothetical protein